MQQSGEPSIEEILDSIKKVIARDNREGAILERRRRAGNLTRESEAEPADAEEAEEGAGGHDEEESGDADLSGLSALLRVVQLKRILDAIGQVLGSMSTFLLSAAVTVICYVTGVGIPAVVAGTALTATSLWRWLVHTTDLVLTTATGGAWLRPRRRRRCARLGV